MRANMKCFIDNGQYSFARRFRVEPQSLQIHKGQHSAISRSALGKREEKRVSHLDRIGCSKLPVLLPD